MKVRYEMRGINTLMNNPKAKDVKVNDNKLWIYLQDGRVLGVPLENFPKLFQADDISRNTFIISGNGTGIHWESLDEDINVPLLFCNTM